MNLLDPSSVVNADDFPARADYRSDEDWEIDVYEWLLGNRPPGVSAPPLAMPCEAGIDRETAVMAWDGLPKPHRDRICPGLTSKALSDGHSYEPPRWSDWPMTAENWERSRKGKKGPRERWGLDARAIADMGTVRCIRHLAARDDAQGACKAVERLLRHIR